MATVTTPIETESEGLYEVVDGQVMEKDVGYPQLLGASELMRALILFDPQERCGWVVSEMLFELRSDTQLARRPDLAFVSYERWPRDRAIEQRSTWPVVPDLVVEFISPTDINTHQRRKRAEYFKAGVQFIWEIDSGDSETAHSALVYEPTGKVQTVGLNDDLDGGHVIPGFRVRLGSLFPPIKIIEE